MSLRPTRATLGNLAVMAALCVIAAALLRLHTAQSWWLAPPLPARWQWAALASALYIAFCAVLWWRQRPAREAPLADGQQPVWVVWASQTGFADALAQRTAAALSQAGVPVRLRALDQFDATQLANATQVLFIASTTGEGDPPDHTAPFLQQVMTRPQDLAQLRYGVLALGDRSYAQFCAFGHQLDHWLRGQGALPLFDMVEVDNADPAALRHWQQLLSQFGGDTGEQADWAAPAYSAWQLRQRQLSNPGSVGQPVYHLQLVPAQGGLPTWEAGDIAEVGPHNTSAHVSAWLAQHGIDGEQPIEGAPLREHLANRQLPDALPTTEATALVAQLPALPHRDYSVASIPEDGALHLLLRLQRRADGTPGIGSGWLCEGVQPGQTVALRLRSNRNFHTPTDAAPLILIGNGTGIAGLRAHLRARIAAGHHRNWLLFGERNAACDFHFGTDIRQWQANGEIERVDLAFSRDADGHHYVQDALAAQADTLRAWVAERATILVCGSLQGMAPAVDAVITQALGRPQRDALLAAGRYRRDVY